MVAAAPCSPRLPLPLLLLAAGQVPLPAPPVCASLCPSLPTVHAVALLAPQTKAAAWVEELTRPRPRLGSCRCGWELHVCPAAMPAQSCALLVCAGWLAVGPAAWVAALLNVAEQAASMPLLVLSCACSSSAAARVVGEQTPPCVLLTGREAGSQGAPQHRRAAGGGCTGVAALAGLGREAWQLPRRCCCPALCAALALPLRRR